ncbi:hypothetical protein [Pantoea sp. Fr+CA_20]|uniref:hypothetical protein n=1 Tax=Pantoea sp. Fr+CA_20 TaxID=2929506 RepID=UPI002118465C|nr:hypothetical protein [Pantoea sp. Fr+CA_20]
MFAWCTLASLSGLTEHESRMIADVATHFTIDGGVKKFCGQRSYMEHLAALHVSYWNNKPR